MASRTVISPADPAIRTMGRIDDADPDRPVWVHPYTQAAFRFTGTSLDATLVNHWNYGDSHLGVIIDGVQSKVRIPSGFAADGIESDDAGWDDGLGRGGEPVTVTLAERLPDIEHEAVVYKRQDGQHYVELLGFGLDEGATVLPTTLPEPTRRIEIYGDSVSCGERNEALLYAGQPDPETDLSPYSDSWKSYGAIAARGLGAALHDVSQGGISLVDGIGWFAGPDYVGQESMWDRIEYNPTLGKAVAWDFARYTPHVVIVAVGQNDANPHDFMADDYDGAESHRWRTRYVDFLRSIHTRYPKAAIVCMTTVLQHDPAWDRAIDEAVQTFNAIPDLPAAEPFGDAVDAPSAVAAASVGDGRPVAHHLLFSRNGAATPGHPRVIEHEEMARELTAFLESLGDAIWED
ncbi:GDSL-type esterase/lipase family protein [Bifidobacterium samirii]|uniref:RnfABCDGE type electron transport complex subunit D n=1 Tax=Bifidobacterium samirii TaxID=2306974 RepID=A0A430FWC0_9BIFI|nr:GDSL-type esterase/lipase family protein [Bifidobacterium samirii]RSX58486.1 RnfABCDGE type electron transport complex subunit D [Bifidobacterium samirii]